MTKAKTIKTGLFFGSFNPIHTGHLIIASYFYENSDIDELWFVVSPQNPLKQSSNLLADRDRLHLVNLAIENDDRFKSSDIEFKLSKPSYTIDTLTYLADKYPKREFVLISGTDIFKTFHKWKNWEKILEYYKFYVYPRPNETQHELLKHPSVKVVNAPMVEISSTFIRKGIKDKMNLKYFLPDSVYNYILEMNFYK